MKHQSAVFDNATGGGMMDPMLATCRSILSALEAHFESTYVSESCSSHSNHSRALYTETHLGLAWLLSSVVADGNPEWLRSSARRFELWERLRKPRAAFNGFAIALAACLTRIKGISDSEPGKVLERLIRNHPQLTVDQVRERQLGNNIYLMHVATVRLLDPIAQGRVPERGAVDDVLREFGRYRTAEGFYFDEPRTAARERERLFPHAYIMKILFLLGICWFITRDGRFQTAFLEGMTAYLKLVGEDGSFAYFGRTDNTTFAMGLTIFNCRLAALLSSGETASLFQTLASRQESMYCSMPRTPEGWLQVNNCRGAQDPIDWQRSRDNYAFPTQYSVASCCYILLSRLVRSPSRSEDLVDRVIPSKYLCTAYSQDLGTLINRSLGSEIVLRVESQPEVRDRRYCGPTILRFVQDGQLLIGAPPMTCEPDLSVLPRETNKLVRFANTMKYRLFQGDEHLHVYLTGYVPMLERGSLAWVPWSVASVSQDETGVTSTHRFAAVRIRGWRVALRQAVEVAAQNLPWLERHDLQAEIYHEMTNITLHRSVQLVDRGVEVSDTINGPIRGLRLWFGARYFGSIARAHVYGLAQAKSLSVWSSDGLQRLDCFGELCEEEQVSYMVRLTRVGGS